MAHGLCVFVLSTLSTFQYSCISIIMCILSSVYKRKYRVYLPQAPPPPGPDPSRADIDPSHHTETHASRDQHKHHSVSYQNNMHKLVDLNSTTEGSRSFTQKMELV